MILAMRPIGGLAAMACLAAATLLASQASAQSGRLKPAAGASATPQAAARVFKRPLLRSGRIQYCLKQLDRYDGRINGRMTTLTERGLRRLRDDLDLKSDDVAQDWALHAVLWRRCREHWVRDGGNLDRFGIATAATAPVPRAPVPAARQEPAAPPAASRTVAPPGAASCLPAELREFLGRAHSRQIDLSACELPCLPLPPQVDRDDAPGYERRYGFSWCSACVPFAGELRLDDIRRIEKAGRITLCPDPQRQMIRPTATVVPATTTTEVLRGVRALFRRDLRAGAEHSGLAVVISVSGYGNGLPARPRAERDAAAVHALLVERLGYRASRVIEVRNPTRAELEGVLGRGSTARGLLADRMKDGADTPVLIYFSGLGALTDDDGEPYLLPVDAVPHRERSTAYPLEALYQSASRLGSGPVTIVLEADFGNDPAGPAISPNAPSGRGTTFPRNAPRQLLVMAASDRDQRPLEDRETGLSLFTRHLVEGLSGHADIGPLGNGDGRSDSAEVFAFAASRTAYAARKLNGLLQRPTISHGRPQPLALHGGPRP